MTIHHIRRATLLLALVAGNSAFAQTQQRQSSSLYLQPAAKHDVIVPFNINDEGHRFNPTWGLDQAWYWDQIINKGVNHMGKENIGIGRIAYRFDKPLINDSVLDQSVIVWMRNRANMFNRIDTKLPLVFTADQDGGADEYFVKNRVCNTAHWAAMINSHVHWMQQNNPHPVVGVSPYNEPDYWTVEEGATVARQVEVARLLRTQYPRLDDVVIVGGNTLNNDKAWDWFRTGTQYYDWGNTHQLAGSFDNYANFFRQVTEAGKVGYADEMHNIVDAMVGLQYGMTIGIWWGFDSRARGELCDITRHGSRLAYAEHRNNWTAASVFRHDDGRVKAFIGGSERQANTTNYLLLSTERDVYYDGYGPVREVLTTLPGGSGYQVAGQTNAERVIDVEWGPDVPPVQITNGLYKIVSKATGNVLCSANNNISMYKYTGMKNQQWNIMPATQRTGGDLSFYDIESAANSQTRMNILNNSCSDNVNVIAYTHDGTPLTNEQWYLQYAGNGYYYMRNRETALYLTAFSTSTNNQVNVLQRKLLDGAQRDLQLWRILPVDVNYDTDAPSAPQGLTAEAAAASVRLEWQAVANADDLLGYNVLRSPAGTNDWNTIARCLQQPYFVDNTCLQKQAYDYRVRAVDRSHNHSEVSATVTATPTGEPALIARWQLDDDSRDVTPAMMDAAIAGSRLFVTDKKQGDKALRLSTASYMQLPYSVASTPELTVALWVKWSTASNWQRIFDFGNDTSHYLFLTPSNGSIMRFGIKNGDDEQTVDCPSKLPLGQWKHVAVTIASGKTTIFVDGEEVASSTAITISPADIRPTLNYLGHSQFTADPNFLGSIDDVRIYNYALNADDIKLIMGDTASSIDAATVATPVTAPTVYTIDGRRLSQPQPGINVMEGKKIVVRK